MTIPPEEDRPGRGRGRSRDRTPLEEASVSPEPSKRFPLLRILFGTWRRLLPSPVGIVRATLSPRRLLRRLRLRWILLFSAATVLWLIAAATEPVGPKPGGGAEPTGEPEPAIAASPTARSRTVSGGPSLSAVASSPEAGSRFFRKVARAVRSGLRTGRVDLSISETEATSALDAVAQLTEIREIMHTLSPEELEELDTPEEVRRALDARSGQARSGLIGRIRYALNPRLRFRQAEVRFRSDGHVLVSGWAQAWSRRVRVHVDAVPTVDEGRLRWVFRETRLGRVPVPAWVLGGPSDLLTTVMGLGKDHVRLEGLQVRDGKLTLSGRIDLPRAR